MICKSKKSKFNSILSENFNLMSCRYKSGLTILQMCKKDMNNNTELNELKQETFYSSSKILKLK